MSDEQTETMLRNVREGLAMDGMPPSALTRHDYRECPMCTASRPRFCDKYYEQENEVLIEQVRSAISDQMTPGGVKATYEQLLELCEQQRLTIDQQAQEIERLRAGQGISSAEMDLSKQLAAMTAERDVMSNSREALVEVVRELRQQLAEAQGTIAELRGKAVKDVSECVSLTNRLTQAEQQVARMREALQVLYDEQNDAPLENRRQQWQAAMTLASGALRETGAYQEVKKTT